ncbi:ribosome-associated heat shock protein Hsp15 [Sphingomonas sp. NFR04]|uniref:RNA-binding S4 domain-containing protein n=1 Tax=Sphingomonas sp. NFR04 TaxID=1566283 RepID=UPI0008E75E94|nr:S4 domain-containing protein [Sphingomonas sp. NFR04]SFJ78112.1 ribosome-associated heat shock protein Hsp15 [Sphingomonas sp. NFR04]
MAEPSAHGPAMRLDRYLWYARIVKTRSAAQALCEKGLLRIDGRRVERSAASVRVGSILAFPIQGKVRVLRVEALPIRRGPPGEARLCYEDLVTDRDVQPLSDD